MSAWRPQADGILPSSTGGWCRWLIAASLREAQDPSHLALERA